MVRGKKPKIVSLIETSLNLEEFEGLKRRMGFEGCFVVELMGKRGGLALL